MFYIKYRYDLLPPYHRPSPGHDLGLRAYFVTICCDRRQPHLRSPVFAQRVLDLLHQNASRYFFVLHEFSIMPDHLHLLAKGTLPKSNVREFIRLFKQQAAYTFRKSTGGVHWEKGDYDYVLCPCDSSEAAACSVW